MEERKQDQRPEWSPDWRLKCVFAIIGLLNFVTAVDATSISVAPTGIQRPGIRTISRDLGGTAIEAFWAGTSFLVASCVCQPILCLASEIFGRRNVLLLAVILFTVGAILAAVSHGFTVLLLGRCIQGLGGGGILGSDRDHFCGPDSIARARKVASWRWIFWFNIPFCGIALLLIAIFLRIDRPPVLLRDRLAKVDYCGAVLFVASLTSFLIPVTWGGVMYSWDAWQTLVPLMLGVAGLGLFAVHEALVADEPLIPLALFRNRTLQMSYLGIFLHGLVLWSLVYYLPLYYEGVLGYRPVISGIAVFPECLTVAPISVVTGLLISKSGNYRWALWMGWPITALGLGVLCLLNSHTSIPRWVFINLPAGLGCGMLFPAVQLAVQAAADPATLTIAATMTAFFRVLGQAVGVAVGGVIFQNRMKAQMGHHPHLGLAADQWVQDASSLVSYIRKLPGDSSLRQVLVTMYASSLMVVWASMCGVAAVGLFSSSFVKRYPLVRKEQTTSSV
ncbi:hypothetical protein N7494_013244 [Penicillium frequentans]|uniref:Major facilitator superfamily (MFS) profile domain-containing protein n=1 Tax=Penicillium frequentans TaxID=3151616 RepID=A0AAD6CHG0_9EURO|nr:hypothetical protein N7494_013244 [Penicillium glabrum]